MLELGKVWDFFNTKVGLLIVGFALTTGFGSLLTYQIERATLKHKLIFTQLHEDRGRAIRDLHERIVDVEQNLKNLYYKYRPVGIDPPDVNEETVVKSVRELRVQVEKARIYFSTGLSKTIDSVCTGFEDALRALEAAYIRKPPTGTQAPDFDQTTFLQHFDHSKKARVQLENEFRKLLGAI